VPTNLPYKRIFFEKEALSFPIVQEMYRRLTDSEHNVDFLPSHNRVTGIPGKSSREAFSG